ncbi:MAG: hypothetical protein DMG05_17295 [Acidobacteria bacterium]|nr:MAG: hypothetical protein DMG05_17295 [Acidobacteriota bacterium]
MTVRLGTPLCFKVALKAIWTLLRGMGWVAVAIPTPLYVPERESSKQGCDGFGSSPGGVPKFCDVFVLDYDEIANINSLLFRSALMEIV